jgi:hypothetical protein
LSCDTIASAGDAMPLAGEAVTSHGRAKDANEVTGLTLALLVAPVALAGVALRAWI